jgi:hypothetical protein
MQSKTLVVLIAVAILGASSTAMAKGGGGGMGMHGHGHFFNHFNNRFRFNNRFLRNQAVLGGWGWGLGGYGDNGYGSNTNVVVFPQAKPQTPDVTGSTSREPCRWNAENIQRSIVSGQYSTS